MKREALLRILRKSGCFLKREGASHSLWCNPETGHVEAVPRHAEISERLAQKILKSLLAHDSKNDSAH
jgi:mRNA interferase HicA